MFVYHFRIILYFENLRLFQLQKKKKLQFTLYIEWAGLDSIYLLSRPTIRMLFMFSVESNENYRLAVYRSCEKRG